MPRIRPCWRAWRRPLLYDRQRPGRYGSQDDRFSTVPHKPYDLVVLSWLDGVQSSDRRMEKPLQRMDGTHETLAGVVSVATAAAELV